METDKKLRSRYNNMKQRCYNSKHPGYKNYGARGIFVCNRWLGENGFEQFKDWAITNGFEENLQLDRIDNSKGYSPSNCRWVDRKVNMRNRRNNVRINNKTLVEISEETKINYDTLETRYKTCGDIILKERYCVYCNKKFMPTKFSQEFCSQECKNQDYGIKVKILIREIRNKKNISLHRLASMTKMSKGHLSRIERGVTDPTISTLIKIAKALNVKEKELYKEIN